MTSHQPNSVLIVEVVLVEDAMRKIAASLIQTSTRFGSYYDHPFVFHLVLTRVCLLRLSSWTSEGRESLLRAWTNAVF